MSLTAERARELLEYEPETGRLIWRVTRSSNAVTGMEAGHIFTTQGLQYRVVRIDRVLYLAHRLIVLIKTGNWPSSEVDHIDGSGLNNRWENLRCVSRDVNAKNCRIRRRNTSGMTGVYWDKSNKKWRAQIMCEGKSISLGRFTDKDSAIAARKAGEKLYDFHENHGRTGGGK